MTSILRFEIHQRLRRISTYVYFLVFSGLAFLFIFIGGGAVNGASLDFGTGGKVLINSPYALTFIITYTSLFGVIVTAALAGQATYQDVDSRSTELFYTAPISKLDYLGGRFLGAIAVQLVIFLGIGIGAWVGAHMPGLDPSRFGPDHFAAYVRPFLILVFPNLIFTSAIFFGLAALGRKMLPVYAGSVILLIGYLVASQVSSNVNISVLAALADPFGANAFGRVTQYWTPFESNTRLLPLAGIVLVNRALWVAIGLGIFALTYVKFSRAHHAERKRGRQLQEREEASTPATLRLPTVHQIFSPFASLQQLVSLGWLQFTETVKNVFFTVIVLAGFLFAIIAAAGVNDPFSTPIYPLTYRMIEFAGGAFSLFVLIIITFYAGELVWRERDAKLNQIVDALPAKRWTLFGSKLMALMLVQVVLMLMVMAAGMSVQIAKGYYHFEFGIYFKELFIDHLTEYWILCVLALTIHTLINQKYLGHFVMILYYIAGIALPALGLQHYLFRIDQIPRLIYSDMNKFGPFKAPLFWFHLYWALGAVALAIITNLLWVRGVDGGWRGRMRIAAARLGTASRIGLVAAVLLFLCTGGYIFYNTNILNIYRNTYAADEARAQYEKKYRQYLTMPEPKVTDVNIQVDLDPDQLSAAVRGTLRLENKTGAPLEQVALTLWPSDLQPLPRQRFELDKLSVAEGQSPVIEDSNLGFYLYRLPQPLAPNAALTLDFAMKYKCEGFVNSAPNVNILRNGSFLSNGYLPGIGYAEGVELTDDSARHRHGLEKVKRLAPLEDIAARQINGIGPDSDWVNLEETVSTSSDQIAIMPGYLQDEWTEGNRRYFHYKMDAPILNIYSLNSGRYLVQRDKWNNVNLEIYYQPGHEFNLDHMQDSMKATLDYCTASFSPFQFRQLRIIEFPRYQSFAESFANTIPFSEGIGFVTRFDPGKPDAIDIPFYVTAHETGHQWWGHQVTAAQVEGATAIVETLAQYTALMVMKHRYGPESMKKFLRYELDGYLRGRATERNEERPLYRVEPNQGYIHYNKGSLVMYALQDYIGEDRVNRGLADLIKQFGFKGPPYATSLDLISCLRKQTPDEFQYLFDDLFENITLYDNRTLSGSYTMRGDGKYDVNLTVQAKKLRADGHGQETQIPISDWIDIGVLDAGGNYLYLQRQKIDHEQTVFNLTVDKLPAKAGIDPINKLVDRSPDDNVIALDKQ
jgi:ABC-2 type transport system permease protein